MRSHSSDGPLFDFSLERGDLYRNYLKWRRENPTMFDLCSRFALQMSAHRSRFGMRLVIERVRWETALYSKDSQFKVNDHIIPYLARELVQKHPELDGKLEFRRVRYGPDAEVPF